MPLRRAVVALMTFCVLFGALIIAGFLSDPMPRGGHAASKARSDISQIQLALTFYRHEQGRYPVGEPAEIVAELVGLNSEPRYQYLDKVFLTRTDPWQTPYRLTFPPSGEAIVVSAGPNKTFGDRDDIEEERHRQPW